MSMGLLPYRSFNLLTIIYYIQNMNMKYVGSGSFANSLFPIWISYIFLFRRIPQPKTKDILQKMR